MATDIPLGLSKAFRWVPHKVCDIIGCNHKTLTARYEKAKSRLDEVETEIHDKNSRRKSIEHYLALMEERKDAVTEYDVRLWHGMVEFVTVYSKDDILFTMKDGTEIRA